MKRISPFQVSLDTVIGTSTMLGHALEDRSSIRESQSLSLLEQIQKVSTVPLHDVAQERSFCVAPLDILVTDEPIAHGKTAKQFHIIEMNGTGIGGLTNLSDDAVAAVLEGFTEMAWHHTAAQPLILVAVSGKESESSPRLNRLLYEKMLYAEALRRGFLDAGFARVVTTNLTQVQQNPEILNQTHPTIVLGYIGELLDALSLDRDGRLLLGHRHVTGAVNDRFCLNVVDRFGNRVDMSQMEPMNRCFLAGADKGVSYGLLNEYQRANSNPMAPRVTDYIHAHDRDALIVSVLRWVREGKKTVIKPHGTGLGHGIEFFLSSEESEGEIIRKIDDSIRTTAQFYRMPGGAFPYTVCLFLNTATIQNPGSPFHGRKYELRVVVYRDRSELKAYPSIAKIAPEVFNPDKPNKQGLINNITNSGVTTQKSGVEHMLPLCLESTLETLNLRPLELMQLCRLATGFVQHVLEATTAEPERFRLAPKHVPMFCEPSKKIGRPASVMSVV